MKSLVLLWQLIYSTCNVKRPLLRKNCHLRVILLFESCQTLQWWSEVNRDLWAFPIELQMSYNLCLYLNLAPGIHLLQFNRSFAWSGHMVKKITYMLVSKLRSGTSKTMQLVPVHLDLALFWKSHCPNCSPTCVILYHVMRSCKGPITWKTATFAFKDVQSSLGVTRWIFFPVSAKAKNV